MLTVSNNSAQSALSLDYTPGRTQTAAKRRHARAPIQATIEGMRPDTLHISALQNLMVT